MKLRHVKLVMSCKPISCYCVLFNDIVSMCTIGMGEEVISVASYSTAARLGYTRTCCKDIYFRKRYFQRDTRNPFVITVFPGCLISCQEKSFDIVISPLMGFCHH